MSVAGGLVRGLEHTQKHDCDVVQIFVKNPNRWMGRSLSHSEAAQFRAFRRSSQIRMVAAHASYLINLASPSLQLWRKSIAALSDELWRCSRLGVDHLVVHPGAHRGRGASWGVRRICRALEKIQAETAGFGVRIALESTAGQGTSIGHRFEHLRDILGGCPTPELSICLDSCHIFAAGYDLRSVEACAETLATFDRVVGAERLRVWHLNDSQRVLGSRVDRHAHIGKGEIGLHGFEWIMKNPAFTRIPKILETPKGPDQKGDRQNLAVLRKMIKS